jgi:hemin uptake protein HemP
MPDMNAKRNSPPRPPGTRGGPETVVESAVLLGDRQELLIRHEGRLYRLRRTRLGKLILTA